MSKSIEKPLLVDIIPTMVKTNYVIRLLFKLKITYLTDEYFPRLRKFAERTYHLKT